MRQPKGQAGFRAKKDANGQKLAQHPILEPLAAPLPAAGEEVARDANGQVADSTAAKELGRRGGLAKAAKREMLQRLGYVKLAESSEFHPYYLHAQEWLKATCEHMLRDHGFLGPGTLGLLQSAAGSKALATWAQDNVFEKGAVALHPMMKNMTDLYKSCLKDARAMAAEDAKYRADAKDTKQGFFDPFAQTEKEDADGGSDQ